MWCSLERLLLPETAWADCVAVAPSWSRADFVRQALGLSARLQAARIGAAALYFDDAAAFACAFLACAHAGVAMYVPPNLAPDSLDWVAGRCDVWLTDRDMPGVVLPCWRPWGPAGELAEGFAGIAAPALLQGDVAVWLKTSGSSGRPQVVRKRVAQFQAEAEAIAAHCRLAQLGPVDAVIGSVSVQHLYGLSFRVVLSLCAGWPIHRRQCSYPEQLLEAALSCQRQVWVASPVLLNHLGEDRAGTLLQQRLALLFSSGGSLPASTSERLASSLGIVPDEIYGSTETGVIAARRGDEAWQCLLPSQHGVDQAGALWFESPWSGGRQQTADLVSARDGGFVLLGRRDRVIKLADKRVSLAQIEQDLLRHPWVRDACCGLHPRHRRLACCVALAPDGITAFREQGRAAVVAALRQHLRQTQDALALPRSWRFEVTLPRNSQAKMERTTFEHLLLQRPLQPQWQVLPSEAGSCRYEGVIPLDLRYFAGHFADFPLVPGVVQLDWVMQLASRLAGLPAHLLQVENLKFRQFLRPNDPVVLTLHRLPATGKLGFSLSSPQGVCASGRLVFGTARGVA